MNRKPQLSSRGCTAAKRVEKSRFTCITSSETVFQFKILKPRLLAVACAVLVVTVEMLCGPLCV